MIKRNCKKRYTLKSPALILALLIVTGVFSACRKSDKEDIARDLNENVTSDSAMKSDAVQEQIPESLSYTIEGSSTIKVDAEVYSEGYGQVPAYKLKKRDKNGMWIMSYAEKLYDNGEYTNVKPYDYCSMEELETEKQFWEERLKALDESSRGYERVEAQIYDIELAIESFSESDYVKHAEGQIVFRKTNYGYEDYSKSYSERAQFRGEVDGNVWLLNYDYKVNEYMIYGENGRELGYGIFPPVLYGSCVEKMDYISGYYGMEAGIYKNKCDREQAESEAEKLLDRLGFNNMECVKITELKPSQAADYCDGYCIIYGPSLNGINMFSFTGVGASADGEHIAVQPYVCVLVNSEGAYSFCILEDYDVEEKFSENSQMISFQQIDNIAHTEFEKKMEKNPNKSYDITKVKFEYLCVTYDGTSYAMIPVWTYYTEWINHGDINLLPVLIINALDGAVIPIEPVYFDWEYSFIWGYYIIVS